MKKERVLYDDSNFEAYERDARECMADAMGEEEYSDEQLYELINELMQEDWEDAGNAMGKFFNPEHNEWGYILVGAMGLWDGTVRGGFTFNNMDDYWRHEPLRDCDYIKIYDVDGHFYVQGIHHDGTNLYEIKELTRRGAELLENWRDNWEDERSLEEIHGIVFNNNLFSKLPHFAHIVWGCPKYEIA